MTTKEYDALTDLEKHIKIAELCGYMLDPEYADAIDPIWDNGMDRCHEDQLPDYLNDLNVMHEAENGMEDTDAFNYGHVLFTIVLRDGGRSLVSATAAQRAEAFVLTMTGDE
jgi:hypothetical protein